MGYSINKEIHKANNKPAITKALRAKEIRYKDLPAAVEVRVGWDLPNGGGTEWEMVSWPEIPSNRNTWAEKLIASCPPGCIPVVLLSSLENPGVTVKEVLSLARRRGFQSVRLVDN